mgnify:CR=1 FL=1
MMPASMVTVKHSILFAGVSVEPGAVVEDAVVMGGTVIKAGAQVRHCIIAENVVIGENAVVGEGALRRAARALQQSVQVFIFGDNAKIGPNAMGQRECKGW